MEKRREDVQGREGKEGSGEGQKTAEQKKKNLEQQCRDGDGGEEGSALGYPAEGEWEEPNFDPAMYLDAYTVHEYYGLGNVYTTGDGSAVHGDDSDESQEDGVESELKRDGEDRIGEKGAAGHTGAEAEGKEDEERRRARDPAKKMERVRSRGRSATLMGQQASQPPGSPSPPSPSSCFTLPSDSSTVSSPPHSPSSSPQIPSHANADFSPSRTPARESKVRGRSQSLSISEACSDWNTRFQIAVDSSLSAGASPEVHSQAHLHMHIYAEKYTDINIDMLLYAQSHISTYAHVYMQISIIYI